MNYIISQDWMKLRGLGNPQMPGPDTETPADRWAEDCRAAVERAVWRYAGREPCGCSDLTTMESIAIAIAAGVEVDYQFVMNTVHVTTRDKIGITWNGGRFEVAVLQERK